MKAIILAAGRGERLRPLTDVTPKPLLKVGGKYLIEYHLLSLYRAGFRDVVINIAWLGQQIIDALGNGEKYNLNLVYSNERNQALETGGGIYNALPLLGNAPFLVVNADVWTDYPFEKLYEFPLQDKAHLVLVDNPPHHEKGDFAIVDNRLVDASENLFTYSGLGVYSVDFFENNQAGKFSLAPIIRDYISVYKISGELYKGCWVDVGTEQRLNKLDKELSRC